MIRNVQFAPREFYHICDRGNRKQEIFTDDRDRIRFLFLILYGQSPAAIIRVDRQVDYFIKHRVFKVDETETSAVVAQRCVSLVCFTLMPNHFHLLIREEENEGVSRYMQKILDAYTKYFNIKYGQSGHLFQGPFRAVHVKKNEQLLYLSAYIHRNPSALRGWRGREHEFPWSSYPDYSNSNQWGSLLDQKILTKQFDSPGDYRRYVEISGAKSPPKGFDPELLLE